MVLIYLMYFTTFPFLSLACVLTVEQAGEPVKDSKTSISVSVGGIKCSVGSQYVSNQDFLEVNSLYICVQKHLSHHYSYDFHLVC